ncbi:MAG TPA: DoxX family protein [Thermoplasmata archaeon]
MLRVFLGAIMMVHGFPKVFDSEKRTQTIAYMERLGVPAPLTLTAGALEFFGGLGLVVGFLTQVAATFIALEMVGTTILSRTKMGKKLVLGYELDLSYLATAVALVFLGAGAWSLDGALGIVVAPLWLAVAVALVAVLASLWLKTERAEGRRR